VSAGRFMGAVKVANEALALLRSYEVELINGHVLADSITFAIDFGDFGRLVARGELRDVTFSRAAPTEEISNHATIKHSAVLASLPDVRIMAVAIQPLVEADPLEAT
jgi:hypothetical protein